ncbi:uncharacterized protein LOC118435092 [Folsomia candida]|uniref:Heat shock cognate 71 kDa protein n=1 Tax=Folsomia candida TaxID=158441 RepID=A0A226F2T9_FOLCA|nr:uncharacterized protein LOC118435092 [Folsomia candida]OXA63724.1 Heat shock cognate 71 kDa protein [Folsomia candida]
MSDEPVRIIDIIDDKGRPRFKLEDELDDILSQAGEHPICLIAISGASRIGKSCFLSYLIRYLDHLEKAKKSPNTDWLPPNSKENVTAFPYKNTLAPQTSGFWIWPKPFIIPGKSGNVAVFIMDTQGVFDSKSMTEWSAIVGISLLTSSVLIFNFQFNPQEDALAALEIFLDYGIMAMEKNSSHSEQSYEEDDQYFPFQNLLCLIRDWNPVGSYGYGFIGGKQCIQKWLATDDPNLTKENISRRQKINRCFEKIQGCLLPNPGDKAKAMHFQGATADLDDIFYRQLKACIERVCRPEDIVVKKIAGRNATYRDLFSLFKTYVKVLNSRSTPGAMGFLEATYEASCDSARTLAFNNFKVESDGWLTSGEYIPVQALTEKLNHLEKKTIGLYVLKSKLGTEDVKAKYKSKLLEDIRLHGAKLMQKTPDMDQILQSLVKEGEEKFHADFNQFCLRHKYDEDTPIPFQEIDSALKTVSEAVFDSFESNPALRNEDLENKFAQALNDKLLVLRTHYKNSNKQKHDKMNDTLAKLVNEPMNEYNQEFDEGRAYLPFLSHNKMDSLNLKCKRRAENKLKNYSESELPQRLKSQAEAMLMKALDASFAEKVEENFKATQKAKDDMNNVIISLVLKFKNHMKNKIDAWGKIPTDMQLYSEYSKFKDTAHNDLMANLPINDPQFYQPLKLQLEEILKKSYDEIIVKIAQDKKVTENHVQGWLEKQEAIYKQQVQQDCNSSLESVEYQNMCKSTKQKILSDTKQELGKIGVQEKNKTPTLTRLKDMLNNVSKSLLEERESKIETLMSDAKQDIEHFISKYSKLMTPQINNSVANSHVSHHKSTKSSVQDEFKLKWSQLPKSKLGILTLELDHKIEEIYESFLTKVELERTEEDKKLSDALAEALQQYSSKMIKQWTLTYVDESDIKKNSDSIKMIIINNFTSKYGNMRNFETYKLDLGNEIDTLYHGEMLKFKNSKKSAREKLIQEVIESCAESYTEKMKKFQNDSNNDLALLEGQHKKLKSQLLRNLTAEANIRTITLARSEINNAENELEEKIDLRYPQFIENAKAALACLEDELKAYVLSVTIDYENKVGRTADGLLAVNDDILNDEHRQFMEECLEHVTKKFANIGQKKLANETSKLSTQLNCQLGNIKARYELKFEEMKKILKGLNNDLKEDLSKVDDPIWDELNKAHVKRRDEGYRTLEKLCNFPTQDLLQDFENQYKAEAKTLFDTNRRGFSNEPDPALLPPVWRELCTLYDAEMDKYVGNSGTYIDPNQLQINHNQAAVYVTKFIKDKKMVPMTAMVKERIKVKLKALGDLRKKNNFMKAPTQQAAIGIDLGTTFSCVAICEPDGQVRVLNNSQNKPTTPSYIRVGVEDVVGEAAKNEASIYPSSTIFDTKRLIGRSYNDPHVQEDMKSWPFTVASDTSGKAVVEVDGTSYAPETISAKLLSKLKEDAEAKSGKTITSAVITVPAYFKDAQKQATKDAGVAAKLNVIELLTEPTAAAVAYSLEFAVAEEKKILIFDFGGGTHDVSILSIKESDVNVLVTDGDNHLGGEDIDTKMMDHCITKFSATNPNVNILDGRDSTDPVLKEQYNRRLRRLRNACETTKIVLSASPTGRVTLDGIIAQGTTRLDLNVEITVDEFNTMNDTLFKRCINIVEKALTDGKLKKSEIDEVVLVGGSTQIPKIQKMLQDFFDGKALNKRLNPDEAVAKGAAIRAAVSHGYESVRSTIHDITPMSIGIKVAGGGFSNIFPKNSKYPDEKTKAYHTSDREQAEVEVSIYEGEDTQAVNNSLLGKFILAGIPTTDELQRVDVTMALDTNGILTVTARCEGNGVTKALTIRDERKIGGDENMECLPPPS